MKTLHMESFRVKESLIVLLLFAGLLCGAFYDVVFLGKTFKLTNSMQQALPTGPYGQENNIPPYMPAHNMETPYMMEPLYEFLGGYFRQGQFPLWNPYQAAGYPMIATMEVGLFYPLNLILYFLPSLISWDVFLLVRFLIAGFLVYQLARVWRFDRVSSFVAAAAFMLSGPMVLVQYIYVNGDILLPAVLIAFEGLIRRPCRKGICFAAAVTALTIFAGHAEHLILIHLYGGAYFVFRLLTGRPAPDRGRSALAFTGSYVIAAGLTAVVTVPFVQFFVRDGWHYHPAHAGLLSVKDYVDVLPTIAMFCPFIFGKLLRPDEFIYSEWWGGYIGLIPMGLAFLGLFPSRTPPGVTLDDKEMTPRGLNCFFGSAAFLILAKYYGLPVINDLGRLPVLKDFFFFTHSLHFIAFTFAVLVGLGMRAVVLSRTVFLKWFGYALTLALVFGAYYFFFPNSEKLWISRPGMIFAGAVVAAGALLLFLKDRGWLKPRWAAVILAVCLCAELFAYIHRGRAVRFNSFPDVPYIDFLKNRPERSRTYGTFWTFSPNTASAYRTDDFGIACFVLSKRYVNFVNHFILANHFEKKFGAPSSMDVRPVTFFLNSKPYLDLLNVEYSTVPKHVSRQAAFISESPFSDLVYSKELDIYRHRDALPRSFIVHRAVFSTNEDEAVMIMTRIRNGFRRVVLLEGKTDPEILSQLNAVPAESDASARITAYGPNRLTVEARTPQPGFLVLGDAYHPDWQARVDGRPVKIYPADTMIRAVFLPAGKHTVEFVFRPLSFYAGAGVSAVFFLFIIFLLLKPGKPVQRTV